MAQERSAAVSFGINPALDPSELRSHFQINGHLQIAHFLNPAGANALHSTLVSETAWSLVLCDGRKIWEATPESRNRHGAEAQAAVLNMAYEGVHHGPAFLHERCFICRTGDERASASEYLGTFVEFMNSMTFIEFCRALTGMTNIERVSAEATCFRHGHFLTFQSLAEPNTVAKFILSLTPDWKLEWGGQLQFRDHFGHVRRAYLPRFNAFTILDARQVHAVSVIAPFARSPLYAITGFLRTDSG